MRYIYIISISLLFAACGNGKETADDSSSSAPSTEIETKPEKEISGDNINIKGVVKDKSAGEEGGGCNFVIEVVIDGSKKVLEPDTLPTKYQKDGAKVVISFDYSRRVSKCLGSMPIVLSEIEDQ